MQKILNPVKNFLHRNKTTLVVGTIGTLATVVGLQHQGIKSMGNFLKDKGLYEEYFHPEEI